MVENIVQAILGEIFYREQVQNPNPGSGRISRPQITVQISIVLAHESLIADFILTVIC